MSIKHHQACNAGYPEKSSGEPPRYTIYSTVGKDVLATCGDCGAFERYRRTAFSDIHGGACESRLYTYSNVRARVGRTSLDIRCPFCEQRVTAFLWSLSGGGKRCDCGAIFSARNTAYKLKGE